MKIAHMEASNVVPSLMTSQLSQNIPEKVVGNSLKTIYSNAFPKGIIVDLKNFLRV